jgi:predicted deacylase
MSAVKGHGKSQYGKKPMALNKSISIGETVVKPGQQASINLKVAKLYTSTPLSMPVQVVCGRRDGPVLFVSAAIHGDELNGVEIIRRLLRLKALGSIRGTLIAVPIVNVYGFLNQSRYLPDRRDLNRSFPGSARGSITARLANTFFKQIVSKADYGIDLHTGAIHRSNLPQIRGNLDDARTLELANSFGVPVIINSNVRDNSLRACVAELGIPVLIYEAGEALRFDELSIRAGLRGVLNVMRLIGMLPARRPARRIVKKEVQPLLARSTSWVRATASGIFNTDVQLGSSVSSGQQLASISDPLGDTTEVMLAPFDGIVIGRNNLPLAHEGDALFNIAEFTNVSTAEDLVEEFTAIHDH